MNIRRATAGDTEIIASYNLALARETESLALPAATVRAGVAALLADTSKGIYFVAEIDGQVAGQVMVTYEWSDWRNGNFWWLQSVYVAAAHRGAGVFKALYARVEDEARKTPGVCGLRLYMDAHNETARAAYRRLGMAETNYVVFERTFQAAPP